MSELNKYYDLKLLDVPYNNSLEHIIDLSKICDIKIKHYYDKYIEGNLLDNDEKESIKIIEDSEVYIVNRVKASIKKNIFLPLEYIRKVYGLEDFQYNGLVFSIMPYISVEYENIYELINNSKNIVYPYFETLINLFQLEKSKYNNMLYLKNSKSGYFKYAFDIDGEIEMSTVMKPTKHLVDFVLEKNYFSTIENSHTFFPEMKCKKIFKNLDRYYEGIKSYIESNCKTPLIIKGSEGIGKKLILRNCSRELNMPITFISREDLEKFSINSIISKLIIDQSLLVIKGVKEINHNLQEVISLATSIDKRVILLSDSLECDEEKEKDFIVLTIDNPSKIENEKMWCIEFPQLKTDTISWLCNRFRYSYGDIEKIVNKTKEAQHIYDSDLDDLVKIISKDYFRSSLGDLVVYIKPSYDWDDLIISSNSKKQLKDACNYVSYKNIIYEEMGLDKKISYGKGLNILLKGSPGTGKTMAAQVISKHLDMELLKVDLSQIISKYIGETEKNLNNIFNRCSNSGVVLFFDEMDSLFSKRTEIKDSKDRNSNLEISFLLQKLEMYEGVVVMATNLLENVDDAFRRRIQHIVDFQVPSIDQRQIIFQRLLDNKIPFGESLDIQFVSKFELVGAEIKNVVIDSIFSAVGNGEELNNKHIILSTYKELEKQGKNPRLKDFGKYSYFIEEYYENYN